jgi:hypothetical protein
MSFATSVNIAAILLCLAMLVQSIRLMRALDAIKAGGLAPMVAALDAATAEARRVLGHLTVLMRGDLAMTAQMLDDGKAMLDELAVMTGIGNAIAERIVEAAVTGNRGLAEAQRAAPAAPEPEKPVTKPERARAGVAKTPCAKPVKLAPPAKSPAARHLPVATERRPFPRAELPPGSIAAAARTAQRLRARLAADHGAETAAVSVTKSLAA